MIGEIHIFIVTKIKLQFDLQKHIFTFWEPHNKIPGYLKLCIKTWKKFLPEYDIIILDYNNIKYYLDEPIFMNFLFKKMTLPIQADAIRIALLKKYGGFWMDTDTIILNREFLAYFNNSDLVMFGDNKRKSPNIGFIYSSKNSTIINVWYELIINNINFYFNTINKVRNSRNMEWKISLQKVKSWNYLGNGIIDPLLENSTNKNFLILDKYKMNVFPELNYCENNSTNPKMMYIKLFFGKGDHIKIINNSKGIILLHNSWTPKKYKKMTEKRFIKQNIIISKLLSHILNKVNTHY